MNSPQVIQDFRNVRPHFGWKLLSDKSCTKDNVINSKPIFCLFERWELLCQIGVSKSAVLKVYGLWIFDYDKFQPSKMQRVIKIKLSIQKVNRSHLNIEQRVDKRMLDFRIDFENIAQKYYFAKWSPKHNYHIPKRIIKW